MGAQPKVSVIVPVYNVESYLPRCLDSLVRQTLDDMEIIVVDDGSMDGSGRIADQYAENHKNMVVIHKPNEGYGKTMNRGLTVAKGEYIGIVESDDWCSPFMFERLYALAKEKTVEVIKSDYYKWWGSDDYCRYQNIAGQELYNIKTNIKRNKQLCFMAPTIWTAIYKRNFLVENEIDFLGTPGASYQDASFHHKVMFCADSLLIINESYIYYRQDNMASSVKDSGKIFCVCDEYEEASQFLQKRDASLIPVLERARVGAYLWNYNRLNEDGRRLFYQRMREDFAKIKNRGFMKRELYGPNAMVKLLSIINFLGKYSHERINNGEVFKEKIIL